MISHSQQTYYVTSPQPLPHPNNILSRFSPKREPCRKTFSQTRAKIISCPLPLLLLLLLHAQSMPQRKFDVNISISHSSNAMLSAERNDRESPLLRLPAELRNQMYEYALTDGTYELRAPKGGIWPCPAGVGIAGVYQKLYYGASLLPFTLNEFDCGVAADLVKLNSRLSIK
jgi:hypothetical protein